MSNLNDICTESLMLYKNQFKNEKNEVLTPNMIALIELLSLLSICGATLNLYDKIICWVKNRIPHSMLEAWTTMDKVVKVMEQSYHLQCMAPK